MIDRQQMTARYGHYREHFLAAVLAAGAELDNIRLPLAGPCGEPLFMDIALLGNRRARRVIVLASGTHGVEGYLGSELQTRLVGAGIADRLGDDTLLIIIHGVNPYGMAWHRRVNENNVDLNRNFLDFDRPLPDNRDYERLTAAVNPRQFGPDDIAAAEQQMTAFFEQHGLMEYLKALSGGQYHNPQGVQYGGQQPQWSNTQLNKIWRRYLPRRETVVNIDLHSGLGNRGDAIVMLNGSRSEARIQRLQACWPNILLSARPTEDDFIMSGVLGNFLEQQFPQLELTAAVLEFGTHEMAAVAKAMIADNWLHQHGDIDSEQGQQIKQQIFDAFYIDDDGYRDQVYHSCEQLLLALLAQVPEQTAG